MKQSVQRAHGVRIAGTGMAVPPRIVTNDELARKIDTSDEWINQRTGICQRHIADESASLFDLAGQALHQAVDRSAIDPSQIDLVICATLTPDMCCPSTAAKLADDIGATPAGALDISAACAGFVYAMNLMVSQIETGRCRNVAVIGAELISRITDWNDRRTCVLFGDGAGAAIFSATDDPQQGCLHQTLASDGSKWDLLYAPKREADLPENSNGFTGAYDTLQMSGREVYKFAVATIQTSIDQTLAACDISPSDLAMVVAHQSNRRILESARDRLGLPESKFYINIDRYGNTSAASVPICLHELSQQQRIGPGDLVLFVGIGGGFTWATSLWRL